MFIAGGLNYHAVFVTCAVASAIAIVCTRLVKVPNDAGTMVRPGSFKISSFLDRRTAVFAVFMFLVAWGNVLAATDYTTMLLICALRSVAAFVQYALVHGRKRG